MQLDQLYCIWSIDAGKGMIRFQKVASNLFCTTESVVRKAEKMHKRLSIFLIDFHYIDLFFFHFGSLKLAIF